MLQFRLKRVSVNVRLQLLLNMQEPEGEPGATQVDHQVVWQVNVNNERRRPLWLDYDEDVSRIIEQWYLRARARPAAPQGFVETLNIDNGWRVCRKDGFGYYWQVRHRRHGSQRLVRRVVVSHPLH